MRSAVGVVALAAILVCAVPAAATVRTDGSIALELPRSAPRAGQLFHVAVQVEDASGLYEAYEYTLTLAFPSAVRALRWSDPFTLPACSSRVAQVTCRARLIGGDHDHAQSYIVFALRASRAGKFPITARLQVAGDPNSANDAVQKTVTVKPKKPVKRR